MNIIRIAGIVKESIVDGPGIRLTVFAQGCKRACPGCHNPGTHPFDGGTLIDISEIIEMIKRNPLLDGITLSGGEPFEQAGTLVELASEVKTLGLNVVAFSGYTYEELTAPEASDDWKRLLEQIDILVDGPYIQEKRNLLLKFRGSENQRLIDLNRTRSEGRVVLWESREGTLL